MPMFSLKQAIQDQAQRLGFCLAGVTNAEPPALVAVFERWLAQGKHAEMTYLATERSRQCRADPRRLLPECRSILVLAAAYPASETKPAASEGSPAEPGAYGRVASYAWGDDYHDTLVEKMKSLVGFIETERQQKTVAYWATDTAPLLERELAQRAGLGWIGKNTCLIHPRLGSYFLLTEILLGIELPPDVPFSQDFCGTCRRCIEACPTACIGGDRTIDAGRCLSYLTIELKGAIPPAQRPALGEWVFGCDICQQVCPWNIRFSGKAPVEAAFAPRPGVPAPDLLHEVALNPQAFQVKFKGSPVKRTRRRGYLRNAVVVLSNQAQQEPGLRPGAIQALASILHHEEEALVRSHAAWGLGRLNEPAAREALQQALVTELDAQVLQEIKAVL